MKFKNLFGRMLGTIDPKTGEPIVDIKFGEGSPVARLLIAHENLHSSEWQRARQHRTPPLPRPDEESLAWLETLREAERMGGIPDSKGLKTRAERNFCSNLRQLQNFYVKHGGSQDHDSSNSDIQAMNEAFTELKRSILGPEGSESKQERGG